MKTVTTISELNQYLLPHRQEKKSIGFVPTMGALHKGHLSLIDRSVKDNDLTVSSIFVNPIQFNNQEDLKLYPRMPSEDSDCLHQHRCDLLFMPSTEEMYPQKSFVQYDFGHLDKVMEGAFRPGHFNGVGIVVNRLLDIVKPHRAYFGLKDYQQFLIIKEMVRQERHPVELIGCETIREQDGLAMSSRNLRLSTTGRKNASQIYSALTYARAHYQKFEVRALEKHLSVLIGDIPGATVEYVTIADHQTLAPVKQWQDCQHCIACVAVYIDNVRLIDNIVLF